MTRILAPLALLLCSFVLAACGGNDDSGDGGSSKSTGDAPTKQQAPPPDPGDFPKALVATWNGDKGGRVTFRDDGTYVGNDGCAPISGRWSVDGDAMELDRNESEPLQCVAPASLILLEEMTWAVAGSTLTLTRPEGSSFELTRAAEVPTS